MSPRNGRQPPRTQSAAARAPASAAVNARLCRLLGRIQHDDDAAFAELYDRTVAAVFALARTLLHNRADAEELLCEVYERAWQAAHAYDGRRGTVLAWLL